MFGVFNDIGKYAPLLIITYTGYQLLTIKPRLYLMLATVAVSYLLNINLKMYLKHPRPEKYIFAENEAHRYGMPSGHMQIFAAVAALYWLSMRIHPVWEWMGIGFLMAISAAERLTTKKHSVAQLAVGAVVGTLTGWVMYLLGRKS